MDSLTQALLGGVVAGAVCAHKYGRKAVVVGAICGTLPDLDVMISYQDDLSSMVNHRGFSHSLIVLTLFAPFLTWLFSIVPWFQLDVRDKCAHFAIWLALVTHPILDAMTIYGTQLLWPLTTHPFGMGSVFIIDPLYTLPLFLSFFTAMFWRRFSILRWGLIISTAYLVWSVAAQLYVTHLARKSMHDHIDQSIVTSLPTPFNTMLWRVLVVDESGKGYKVGYYSLFDDNQTIEFNRYEASPLFIESEDVARLQAFTKGFNNIVQIDNQIVIQDIRMGLEPYDYVFQYSVGLVENGQVKVTPNEQYKIPRDTRSRIKNVWNRIWDEGVIL